MEFGSGEEDGDDDSYHNHQDALLLLPTAFAAVVRELDSQGVVKLPTSPALAATAASAVELVPRGEGGDGDTVAGDEGSVFSFTMLSLRIASIGFVFLRLVCYFMYTGSGVVCVCAGLSKRWRVRSPPPHVFKVASCF